jgi:hypothetical protein
MSTKTSLTFRIFKGDQLLRTETLAQPVIKIGKLSSSHLRIDDDLVSRMHAVIEVTPTGEISIIDLGSTKGTIVNGQKVNKATLQSGDSILLGDTKIMLTVEVEEAEVAPAPAAAAAAAAAAPAAAAAAAAPAMTAAAPPPRPGVPPPPGIRPPMPPARTAAPAAPSFGADAAEDVGGPRYIEVAGMLQDSVIEVRHLRNPRGGKRSPLTYGLFGIGALSLLVAMTAFYHGISVAKANKKALDKWTEELKLPITDFRPRRLNPGWDLMAFGGLGAGLLMLTWGVARSLDERRSPYFRIGQGQGVEFPTSDAPSESFPLVAPQGDDFVFSWAEGMKGEMMLEGKTTPLEQMPKTGPIPHKARIRVQLGATTFLVSSVPAPRHKLTTLLGSLDAMLFTFVGVSALVHGAILILMYLVPVGTKGTFGEGEGEDSRYTKVQVKPPEEPKKVETITEDKKDEPSGGTGTKMAGEEGKMGKKDSTRQSGQYAMKNNGADPQVAKNARMEMAKSSGVLGVLRAQQGGAFASITGTGDFSSGLDDRDVYGGLIGNEVGEMAGGWGYGVSGTGAGGGGTGMGTIGTGSYGTIGHGSGTGSGYGVGSGRGGMHGRSAGTPKVAIGSATAVGDLDKNTIRRYVRQKLPQIEYCYQKQLIVSPGLAGTVNTAFTIDGNGRVIAVKASGIGNSEVESCVADTIRSIQFPKPTGGGMVQVTSYPFTFRPAGGG